MNKKITQSTSHFFMIEPVCFYPKSNSSDNSKQQNNLNSSEENKKIQQKAHKEHSEFRKLLSSNDLTVFCAFGNENSPNDLFCNNWVSTHSDGTYNIYPLLNTNRRVERRKYLIKEFENSYKLKQNFSLFEKQEKFLESTNSMVLDRVNKICYAARSAHTDESLVKHWCQLMQYEPVIFDCSYPKEIGNYHTNIVMFLGTQVTALYLDGIPEEQRNLITNTITRTNKKIIDLSYEQILSFNGNCIEAISTKGYLYLIMSKNAFNSFTSIQKNLLKRHYHKLLYSDLSTIEKHGRGSARSLLLELF
jgi:hypothetical protein